MIQNSSKKVGLLLAGKMIPLTKPDHRLCRRFQCTSLHVETYVSVWNYVVFRRQNMKRYIDPHYLEVLPSHEMTEALGYRCYEYLPWLLYPIQELIDTVKSDLLQKDLVVYLPAHMALVHPLDLDCFDPDYLYVPHYDSEMGSLDLSCIVTGPELLIHFLEGIYDDYMESCEMLLPREEINGISFFYQHLVRRNLQDRVFPTDVLEYRQLDWKIA